MTIPSRFRDLFEKRTFAHFSTLMPDGTPQTTPVWVDYDPDAGHLLVNTARGRRKERNARRDPSVGASMVDPDDPYRFLSVRGRVVEFQEEGADDHIDDLARRYMDVDEYPGRGDDEGARVILRIGVDGVATS